MRRFVSLALGAGLLLGPVAPVFAVRPDASCPDESSGFVTVDQQGWWDNTVAGFVAEGIPVYIGGDPANGFTEEFEDFAMAFGFADAQAFYDYIWGPQWQRIDRNDDLLVCMKPYPLTPGNPAYLFNGIDNTAN